MMSSLDRQKRVGAAVLLGLAWVNLPVLLIMFGGWIGFFILVQKSGLRLHFSPTMTSSDSREIRPQSLQWPEADSGRAVWQVGRMRSQFRTTPWRSLLAVLAGLSICAVIFGAIVTLVAALDGRFQSVDWNWVGQQLGGSALLIVGAVGAVICVIGIPLWLPLHFVGRRHWLLAVLLGAFLFFIGWFGPHTAWFSMPLNGDGYDDYGWSDAARDSVGAALVGALVAFVMWRVAYRKALEVA